MRETEAERASADRNLPSEKTAGLPVLPPAAALAEIGILIVLPGLLDLFVSGFPSLNETQPHFFWLPVLLLTLQYGSASGLLAAGNAIILASLLGWPEQEIGENHFSYLLRIWLQPVLWISTAVILGQLRLRQIERKQTLGREVVALTEQRREIADYASRMRERCENLERLIATRETGDAQALLAALGGALSSSPEIAARALDDALTQAFGDATISVLVLEGDALRPALRHGAGASSERSTISSSSALYLAVVTEAKHLSVLTPGHETILDGHGVAAVPLIAATETIAGVLLLETCAPHLLDHATTDRLATIASVICAGKLLAQPTPATYRAAPLETDRNPPTSVPPWRRVRWQDGARVPPGEASTGRSR